MLRNGRLKIFDEGIKANRSLVKYINIENGMNVGEVKYKNLTINNIEPENTNQEITLKSATAFIDKYSYFRDISDEDFLKGLNTSKIREFNVKISQASIDKFKRNNSDMSLSFGFADNSKSEQKNLGLIDKFFNFVKSKIEKRENKNKETFELSVFDFFDNIKLLSTDNIKPFENAITKHLNMIEKAEIAGQEALKEHLIDNLKIAQYEAVLYAHDFNKYISEATILDLISKTERGLKLDYIKNFGRVIPDDVIQKIDELNKLEIFDNYVVLHYDPFDKGHKMTKKEIEKKKDPIVFGVIIDSDKLYYVGDWIDEYCDLTLEKIVEVLGENKIELLH